MSRESDLEKEVQMKTKEYEKIRNEKLKAEKALAIHTKNMVIANNIKYTLKCLDAISTYEERKSPWTITIGAGSKDGVSYIKFTNGGIVSIPTANMWKELIPHIKDILEKEKIKYEEE